MLFRFRLRTLLVIVLLFAVLSAWIGDDLIRSRVQRPVVARIEAAGGNVYYDYQVRPTGIHPDTPPPGSQFVQSLFGKDIYATATCVSFHNAQPTNDDVKSFQQLPGLLDVAINGNKITDECINDLVKIRHLRSLNLSSTTISPAGISKLRASTTLQHLTLYGGSVTDEHLVGLTGFPNLQSLQIIRAPISDNGLRSVGTIDRLKQLDILQCSNITDAGILEIGQLENLERLHVMQAALNDASLKAIAKLRRLRTLCLDGPITDTGFRRLGELRLLEVLDLRDTGVGDGALATISNFVRLKHLDLWGTEVSDAGLSSLSSLNDLVHLDIAGTKVTDAGLIHLANLPLLTSLSVEIDAGITKEGVDRLKIAMPNCTLTCWDLEPDGSGFMVDTR
ncbi:MAG: hypothetical protein AAF745_13595 [Planctomycetota bacterium]